MQFLFEKLVAYEKAVAFAGRVHQELETANTANLPGLADQLSRAAISISLNLAEGHGRWHPGDKRKFYFIARGSIFECIPLIQILKMRERIGEQVYQELYESLVQLAKLVSGLIKSVDGRHETKRPVGAA